MKSDPLLQRRAQIDRSIASLQTKRHAMKRSAYKSDAAFEAANLRIFRSIEELDEELSILNFPDAYNEIPLAIAAGELGVKVVDLQVAAAEGLITLSYDAISGAGSRITRDELGRIIGIGPEEMVRRAYLDPPQIFNEVLDKIPAGNVTELRKASERIERRDSCINPYALACEIGVHFLDQNVTELQSSIEFILQRDFDDSIVSIAVAREIMVRLPAGSHPFEVIRERFLAVAEGKKVLPFRESLDPYRATVFPSQMDENQRLSLLVADVVMESIRRYKFLKSFESTRRFAEGKETEIQRVVENAIYTALEAHRNYSESPSCKLFVDRITESKPRRRVPPQIVEVLPATGTSKR